MPDTFELDEWIKEGEAKSLGLPGFEDAWKIAELLWIHGKTKYADQHECFYHMVNKSWFPAFEMRGADYRSLEGLKKKFKAAYLRAIQHAFDGHHFEKCPELIKREKHPPIEKEEGKKRCSALRDLLA